MSERVQDCILKVFVVLYIGLCALVIIDSDYLKCSCCKDACTTNAPEQVQDQPTNKIFETISMFTPAETPNAQLNWLQRPESGDLADLAGYTVEETLPIDADTLAQILDGRFYADPVDGVVNSGIYCPLAQVEYDTADGQHVMLVYSRGNAQVDVLVNGEAYASGLTRDTNELFQLLESIGA